MSKFFWEILKPNSVHISEYLGELCNAAVYLLSYILYEHIKLIKYDTVRKLFSGH